MKSKMLLCRLFTLSLVLALTVVFGNGELTTFPGFPGCATAQAAVDSVPAESEGSAMAPLEGVFAPIFFVLMGLQVFVLMGLQVDVTTLANPQVMLVGLALTALAIVSKVAAALPLSGGYNRLVIGLGMVPRGEVGLIFASIGRVMDILDTALYSVVIIMVLLTTLVTPPSLTWALRRRE